MEGSVRVKTMLKAFISAVSLVLICAMFSSCGLVFITERFDDRKNAAIEDTFTVPDIKVPEVPVRGSERKEYDPVPALDALPDYEFDGGYFSIITLEESILFHDKTGDLYYDASEKLREAVAKKFDLQFYHQIPDNSDLERYIGEKTVGGYYADLMMVPYSEVEGLKAAGQISAFNDKAFFIADSEFFDTGIMSVMNGEDGIFAVCSKALRDFRNSYCLFFRHDSVDREKLYSAAKDGTLTWDTLISEIGNGGIIFDGSSSVITDRYISDYDKLICEDEPYRGFLDGKAAVMIAPISDIEKLSGMSDAFGILPMPKGSVSDSYKGFCGGADNMDVLVCPVNTQSPELTVLVIYSLCAASGDVYRDCTVDYYADYVRDESSYSMLDLIFSPDSTEG